MAYIWEKERITIKLKGFETEKDFLPLDVIDLPVELVSDDGEIYMLWITDDKEGEWWYVVETSRDIVVEYIEGKISVRDIFDKGHVYVAFRYYESYDKIQNLTPLKDKIAEGFIKEDELPTYNAKFEADAETIEEIKSLIFKQINIEEIKSDIELPSAIYSDAPEVEVSIAA